MPTITSFQSGDWHTGSTWVGGVVPDETCDVVIAAGHVVTVNAATTITAKSLTSTGGMVEILDGSGVTIRIDSIVAGTPVKRPDLAQNCLIYVASLSAGQTITIIADSILGGDTGTIGPECPRAILSYVLNGAWVLRSDNLSHTVLQGGLTGAAFALYGTTSHCTFDFTAEVIQSLGGASPTSQAVQIGSGNSMTWSGDISGCMFCRTRTGIWHANVTGITGDSEGAAGALNIESAPLAGPVVQHEVYGNITGGSGAYAVGIRVSGYARVYIYGDIKAGTGVEAYGVYAVSHTDYTNMRVFQGYGFDLLNASGEVEEDVPYTAINSHIILGYTWFITAEVGSIDDLVAIEASGLMLGKFVQIADISGDWDEYTPIGSLQPFVGEYNGYDYISGNVYKIIGSSYSGSNYYEGLFSVLSGTVKNVQIVGLSIDSAGHAGGLIGKAIEATITRCSVRGALSGPWYLGGLCGEAYNTSFDECYCYVTADGDNVGLIGYGIDNIFTNCYHTKEGDTNGSYKTETELKDKLKYIDWDFYKIWNIDPEGVINDGYPYLGYREVVRAQISANFSVGTKIAIE
jgi:hypothetical protein